MLKHTFLRGVHDLNVIAAIITPRSDSGVLKKCTSAGTFMFGIEERSLLWEQDYAFPGWAWVYKDKTRGFSSFVERLKQATKADGYDVELVMLYGADCGSPDDIPTGAYGCETVIMTDIARKADFQRSNGRLRDFEDCTRWRRIPVDKEHLERQARAKAYKAMQRMQATHPSEAKSISDEGKDATVNLLLQSVNVIVTRSCLHRKDDTSNCRKSGERLGISPILSPSISQSNNYNTLRKVQICSS